MLLHFVLVNDSEIGKIIIEKGFEEAEDLISYFFKYLFSAQPTRDHQKLKKSSLELPPFSSQGWSVMNSFIRLIWKNHKS